jgi:SAM-dependent methyltransferase
MPSSQSEWDAKYRLAEEGAATEPAGILCELKPLLPAGPALDLACGSGRNSLFLAERGRRVTAVDWSEPALRILEARAQGKKIPVRRIQNFAQSGPIKRAGIDVLHADLEKIHLPEHSYDLIVCIRYLQRPLFPQISRALRPGGLLLYETFTLAQLDFEGGPRDPSHLLKPGELREAFPDLCVLFYRELRAGQGIASLAARKACAVNRNLNGH